MRRDAALHRIPLALAVSLLSVSVSAQWLGREDFSPNSVVPDGVATEDWQSILLDLETRLRNPRVLTVRMWPFPPQGCPGTEKPPLEPSVEAYFDKIAGELPACSLIIQAAESDAIFRMRYVREDEQWNRIDFLD